MADLKEENSDNKMAIKSLVRRKDLRYTISSSLFFRKRINPY